MNGSKRPPRERSRPDSASEAPPLALPPGRYPLEDHRPFLQALDLLPHGMAFFDFAGMLLCANRQLAGIIQHAAEGDRLFQEILRLAQEWGALLRQSPSRGRSDTGSPTALLLRELTSLDGNYRLRASRIDVDLFGLGPSLLITVDSPQPLPPPEEAIRLRFGLTRSESRVAQFLADGRSNKGIAAELGISAHTARHHTQSVLQKLGVRSRGEAGQRLRG